MIVVIDTNIWKQHLFLRSPLAAALQLYLSEKDYFLGLPKIVEDEIRKHLQTEILNLKKSIIVQHDRLLSIFMEMPEVVLPNDDEIKDIVSEFFADSGFYFKRMPMDLKIARGAIDRVVNRAAPSQDGKVQDSLIWESCLRWLESDNVTLVSNDKAFFTDKNINDSLYLETKPKKFDLTLVSRIEDILDSISDPIVCPRDDFLSAVYSQFGQSLDDLVSSAEAQITECTKLNLKYFASETHNLVYITGSALFDCVTANVDEPAGSAFIELECGWNIQSKEFSQFQLKKMEYYFQDNFGKQTKSVSVFSAGTAVIGHRNVNRKFRYALPEH